MSDYFLPLNSKTIGERLRGPLGIDFDSVVDFIRVTYE